MILYGQMYLIGDMEAGAVLEFHEEPLLVWPVSMSYMAASQITGSEKDEKESGSEVLQSAERNGLISYYIGQQFSKSSTDGYLIGIGADGGVITSENLKDQVSDGLVLYSSKLSVSAGEEDLIYRSGLTNRPEINSGNGAIYSDGLTMYGTEPLAVEYVLGEDIQIEKLSFLPVADVFLDDPSYYYLKRFDGAAFFYNYTTKSFDRVNLAQVDFTAEELRPYLSQTGNIIVKYTVHEGDSAGVSNLLPHLMVTGREN